MCTHHSPNLYKLCLSPFPGVRILYVFQSHVKTRFDFYGLINTQVVIVRAIATNGKFLFIYSYSYIYKQQTSVQPTAACGMLSVKLPKLKLSFDSINISIYLRGGLLVAREEWRLGTVYMRLFHELGTELRTKTRAE